jgi:hypothetical protein
MKTESVLGAMPLIPKLYMDCNVKRNLMEKTAYKSDLKVIILGVGPLGFPLIPFISVTHLL